MKSNALHFIFVSVIACSLCLDSYATGAKTKIAEKAVAASAAKIAAANPYVRRFFPPQT